MASRFTRLLNATAMTVVATFAGIGTATASAAEGPNARLLLTFTNGSTWLMPTHPVPATGINWAPVSTVRLVC